MQHRLIFQSMHHNITIKSGILLCHYKSGAGCRRVSRGNIIQQRSPNSAAIKQRSPNYRIGIYYCCITVVLLLYYCCITVVLLLYYCCITVVLLLYYCCITVVLLYHYFIITLS